MSDGSTDIARDRSRGERFKIYLNNLAVYLNKKTKKNYQALKHSAKQVEEVERGYNSSKTSLAETLDKSLRKLKQGDKKIWARLLLGLNIDSEEHISLKELSPYKGKTLVKIDYGYGFVSIDVHGLEEKVRQTLDKQDFPVYKGDKYLLIIPEINDDIQKSEIIPLSGRNPRKKKKKAKNN